MLGYHSLALSPSFLIAHPPTHSDPLAHPLAYPPAHLPSCPLAALPNCSTTHSLAYLHPHPLAHSPSCPLLAHPLTHLLTHLPALPAHPITHSPNCMSTCLHAPPDHLLAHLDMMEMWHDWVTFNLMPSCSVCFHMPHPTCPVQRTRSRSATTTTVHCLRLSMDLYPGVWVTYPRVRAQHEYKYFHGYLWVHPWENLYKQITCVQVPGA